MSNDDEAQYRAYEPATRWPSAEKMYQRERRERIATAALQGLLAHDGWDETPNWDIAADAVSMADALITALDAPKEPGE